jgi:hypothetical protein
MLFGVGVATLLLLFVGIHNVWDNVDYTNLPTMLSGNVARMQGKDRHRSKRVRLFSKRKRKSFQQAAH